MPEVVLNEKLAEILTQHGVEITVDDEFIYTDLPSKVKLKARAIFTEINGCISSQMDVTVIPDTGEMIMESFGDFGKDIESATTNNLANFCMGSLHPLLAAFGSENHEILDQITIEEWEIAGKVWIAYIGNLVPKTNNTNHVKPPEYFYNAIETSIRAQSLGNNLHWFRGYYLQYKETINASEFLMDNVDVTNSNPLFSSVPVIENVEYYSCRNFIILRRKR
jgi:hypothetical protein